MRIRGSWLAPASLICSIALSASPAGAGTIGLRWDSVQNAVGYRIYYGQSSGEYSHSVNVGNLVETTISGLADCTTYYLAVKAYNGAGESAQFSNEISGWSRPEINSYQPWQAEQGSQYTLNIMGGNFQPGAELIVEGTNIPTDVEGNALLRLDNVSVLGCNQIQALMTVEPMARGFRAMEIGDLSLTFSVLNPDQVYGSNAASLEILFNEARSDINRDDASTTDRVDGRDLVWLAYAYGSSEGDSLYNPDADLDGDGMVDGVDLAFLATSFGMCWNGSRWSSTACP